MPEPQPVGVSYELLLGSVVVAVVTLFAWVIKTVVGRIADGQDKIHTTMQRVADGVERIPAAVKEAVRDRDRV